MQISLRVVLARLSVHFPAVLTSITIVALNLSTLHLGRNIPGPIIDNDITLAIFQKLAKLQELLIIAGLTIIVLHVLRWELLFGDGVSFGFLCSGFIFSQISYFCTSDFWGALQGRVSLGGKVLHCACVDSVWSNRRFCRPRCGYLTCTQNARLAC